MNARGIIESAAPSGERLTLERVESGVAWLRGRSMTLDMPSAWKQGDRDFTLSEATEIRYADNFQFDGFSGCAVVARTPGKVLCVTLSESGEVDGWWIFHIRLGSS